MNEKIKSLTRQRDGINSSDCEQEGFTLSDFEFEFVEDCERTYVVGVSVGNKIFYVNCQHGITHSYSLSKYVSCSNESGSDYTDSGLAAFVEKNCEWLSDEIQSLIDECAQPHSKKTTEEYLESLTDIILKKNSDDGVFGACFANNCSFSRYDEIGGERIVITADDIDEDIPEKIIGKDYITFENKNEYIEWYDLHQEQDQYGSISAAYRAYKSMRQQEEEC